ncbi:MAG: YlmC/YmxH family sporulation protein [Bacilli bacterium]
MRLSDLQDKDIINVVDGKNVGNIIDALIEEDGRISKIIVEPSRSFRNIMNVGKEVEIPFKSITKIGEDVILVDISV